VQRDSFDRLLVQHLPAAQRFAIRLAGDPYRAEDLLQDAIVRAVKGCDGFESRSRFTTWLFQIIVNCFRDRLRCKDGLSQASEEPSEDMRAIDPSGGLSERELASLVARRVSALPPRQREVLVLVAYQNMSVAEVAEVLGISQTNVRVNLSYARERLKKELTGLL